MGSEIVVVQIAVRIFARRLTYHYASVQTVHFLQSCVGVPEVRTFVSSSPLVPGSLKISINLLIDSILEIWRNVGWNLVLKQGLIR